MKLLLLTLLLFQLSISFSQTYFGQIITKENDSLNVEISIKGNMIFYANKILSIQEKIDVISKNNTKEYFPRDLKSFKIRMDGDKIQTFDNINDSIFAERYYSNKVKLYFKLTKIETRQSPYFAIYNSFIIKKPNKDNLIELIPDGFSRIITKKQMLAKFTDCKISFDKISNDEIKIKNKKKLIEFIIDYEKNCFAN